MAAFGLARYSASYGLGGYIAHRTQESYTTFDARLSLFAASDRWELSAWGKNLSDKAIKADVGGTGSGTSDLAIYRQPRSFGVDFRYNFN
jgi:outer membrane receptor for ferric coprogen and ferric-rhodotorulic acid